MFKDGRTDGQVVSPTDGMTKSPFGVSGGDRLRPPPLKTTIIEIQKLRTVDK